MENEETVSETDTGLQSQELKISKLAIASIAFGVLGPFSSGAMWVLSFSNFLTIGKSFIVVPFSCGVAWILGLVLGMKSLEQIKNSEGQLVGREYAIVGILTSTVWMFLIFVGIFLPGIYYVNS